MLRTLIIGGGYIGSALVEYWKNDEARSVMVTTTSPTKQKAFEAQGQNAAIAMGNDLKTIRDLLNQADQVVISVAPHRDASYEETYLETAKTVCAALADNISVKHVVYLGTTSVYGDRGGDWVFEEMKLTPLNDKGKILAETEAIYVASSTDQRLVTVLRLSGIYGPGRSHESRVERMAGTIIPGNGDAYCNWVHQEDIVRAIDWVLANRLDGIFNVCSDDHPTKQELYGKIAEALGVESVSWDPSKTGVHGGNRRVSNQKIRNTGFSFLHTIDHKQVS